MKANKRPGQNLKGLSVPELLGVSGEESALEIELTLIHPFKDHPFKVVDDERMDDLVESVKANGILSPVLLRESGMGHYEMISGHRRMHAAKLAGLTKIPAIIREMTDDEATIMMVDANIQREELLPSEKAFAFKMKLEAMKHQGVKGTPSSCHYGTKYRADNELASQVGSSPRNIQRFIRLTELIPELLEMVDTKRITFVAGVEISHIDKVIQKWLYEYIYYNGVIKMDQIAALRKRLESGMVDRDEMISLLNNCINGKLPAVKIHLPEKKLKKYFTSQYSVEEMEKIIYSLLDEWKQRQGG